MVHGHLLLVGVAVRTTVAMPVQDGCPVLRFEAGTLARSATFVVLRHGPHAPLVRASAFSRTCLLVSIGAGFDPAVAHYAFRSHVPRITEEPPVNN